jgi:outer membrane protein TolC
MHKFDAKIIILMVIFVLSGCMVGPDFETPAAPQTETYSETPLSKKTVMAPGIHGGEAQEYILGQEIPDKWWELFHSPKLNSLLERGFKNNPDLKSAVETLWGAEDDLRALIGSTMYPSIGADLFGGREQLSALDSLEGTPGANLADFPRQILTTYNASVSVSYVFDVFGGNRRAIEALRAQVDFERYELEATYLTLAGNIVTTAILEGSLRAQIKATQEIIKQEQKQLDLTKKRINIVA